MRFTRMERWERFEWTKRKLASAEKRPDRQLARVQAKYPLLAEQLVEPALPFDADEEKRARQVQHDSFEANQRAFNSRVWRESRADYFRATPEQRASIQEAWRNWPGPTTPLYFRYVVDLHTGVMEARSQKMRAAQRAMNERIFADEQSRPQTMPLIFEI